MSLKMLSQAFSREEKMLSCSFSDAFVGALSGRP
jgi:hypothetical protein